MKPINEYLLSKNSAKTNHVVSAKVADHENDIVNPDNYNSYIDFFNWLCKAMKEYGDLTEEECVLFKPNDDHLTLYSDGSIVLHNNDTKTIVNADFSISDKKRSFKELYDLIIKFIQENMDKVQ